MKNINLRYVLVLLMAASVGLFFILIKVQNINEITFINTFKLVPKVISIDLLLIAGFSTFMWKWKIFKNWLVVFPNLNGTWKGAIHTTWIDPITGKRPDPIPAILTIHQSFVRISCVMRTAEMVSQSLSADLILEKENQLKRLIYTYDSNPISTVKDRSPKHYGTMIFDICEKPKTLSGEYWTGRKTTGQIEMTFWKKEKLQVFPKILGEHPVGKLRAGT